MIEGMASDLFAAVNPKLAELRLTPKSYWAVHAKADMKHQVLGLDLIPDHEPDSLVESRYARIAWEENTSGSSLTIYTRNVKCKAYPQAFSIPIRFSQS
jgi:hypothetical protein